MSKSIILRTVALTVRLVTFATCANVVLGKSVEMIVCISQLLFAVDVLNDTMEK